MCVSVCDARESLSLLLFVILLNIVRTLTKRTLVTLVSEVTMTHPDSLPLPEIHAVSGDFSRAWTRFELVTKAKEWDDGKQLSILPMLLRGKLIDYYIDLPEDIKGDLRKLRDTLQEKAGLTKDPFSASMAFNTRNQEDDERAGDFAIELTKLFKQAYPEENTMSTVLLQ